MSRTRRRGFSLFELLVILAILAILLGLLLPAIQKVRESASRIQSVNNIKQIGLACYNYHDAHGFFPSGNDANNFSALARLLPYVEQANIHSQLDFNKPIDVEPNAQARRFILKICLSPTDPVQTVREDAGPTNYLFCAGSKADLTDNDGIFYQNSKVKISDVTDGTSNTVLLAETTKGRIAADPINVLTQHVGLGKDALKDLKEDSGVDDWKAGKNIAGDRGASWLDGRFLQGTFTGTRAVNDARPDVNCEGFGGLSGPRSYSSSGAAVGMCDGSVRTISPKTKAEVWKLLSSRNDGQPLPADF